MGDFRFSGWKTLSSYWHNQTIMKIQGYNSSRSFAKSKWKASEVTCNRIHNIFRRKQHTKTLSQSSSSIAAARL